jgi:hypothetical protein
MKIQFANLGTSPIWLYYDRHGPEGGIGLPPKTQAVVTVRRNDTDDNPISIELLDGKVIMFESATVEQTPVPENVLPAWPYDDNGRLADLAEWQQQFMLGLHDLWSDAGEAEFPSDLIEELNALRHRFMDEFERRFPGYGKGRAVWR